MRFSEIAFTLITECLQTHAMSALISVITFRVFIVWTSDFLSLLILLHLQEWYAKLTLALFIGPMFSFFSLYPFYYA